MQYLSPTTNLQTRLVATDCTKDKAEFLFLLLKRRRSPVTAKLRGLGTPHANVVMTRLNAVCVTFCAFRKWLPAPSVASLHTKLVYWESESMVTLEIDTNYTS